MSTGCGKGLVPNHDLNDTGCIPKIKKRNSTMIPSTRHPPGQGHRCSSVAGTKGAGGVGTHHGAGLLIPCGNSYAYPAATPDPTVGPPSFPTVFAAAAPLALAS